MTPQPDTPPQPQAAPRTARALQAPQTSRTARPREATRATQSGLPRPVLGRQTASSRRPRTPPGPLRPWGYLRESLSLASLILSGSARARRLSEELDHHLHLPLPRTCRVAVVPTAPGCGSTTTALHLAALVSRARRLPALVLSASPGPASAADHLEFSRPWPPSPGAIASPPGGASGDPASDTTSGETAGTVATGTVTAATTATSTRHTGTMTTSAEARELTGTGPDGLLSCLRLPPATTSVPEAWDSARRRVMRFFDLAVTETGCLPPAAITELGRHHHAVVLVSPARRDCLERARELATSIRTGLGTAAGTGADTGSRPGAGTGTTPATGTSAGAATTSTPQILHVVVTTAAGRPLVPALHDAELLVGYDPALATPPGTAGTAGRQHLARGRAPGFLSPATTRSLARLGAAVLLAAASSGSQAARQAQADQAAHAPQPVWRAS